MGAGLDRQFYVGADGDLSVLRASRLVVVGYGNLGRSVALNLRDSGLDVLVGNREDEAAAAARADGFTVEPVADAVAAADVLWMLLPDEVIPEVLSPHALSHPAPGSLVCFSSGYALAFDLVDLGDHEVDVVMIAPRMVGSEVRHRYQDGQGFVAYLSVEQDATGTAADRLLALARGVGTEQLRGMALSARDEATVDLFVEQTLGPYLGMALLSAFEVATGAGLPAEALALELYMSGEMSRTWQAFADQGFFRAVQLHGRAAAFGGFLRFAEVDTEAMKQFFTSTLAEVRDGTFAKRLQKEASDGYPTFELIDAMTAGTDPLSQAESRVRRAFGDEEVPRPSAEES